ncbi:MAG: response regulator [Candidatus Thiodiazotropha sp.]
MSSRPTVLIVDDEVRSLETLQRILDDDFDVKTAENIGEARRILETDWVQIILCDQRMPEISGVEFLKQVREQWPEWQRLRAHTHMD